jgi:hypothetical protein
VAFITDPPWRRSTAVTLPGSIDGRERGEVGLARVGTDATQRFSTVTVTRGETTWSIRSAVGVIVYLRR